MARIDPIPPHKRPLLLRVANWYFRRKYGQESTALGVLALSPKLLFPFLVMSAGLAGARTALSPETRALVMQLVADANDCAWCIDYGLANAAEEGLSPDKLLAVADYATDPRFTGAERAALAYAEIVTEGDGHVPQAMFDALRPHFSDREIVELTVSIALENFFNRLNGPLQIESQNFSGLGTAVPAHAGIPPAAGLQAVQ
jgi:AhpD family alkylhydroperoxidase